MDIMDITIITIIIANCIINEHIIKRESIELLLLLLINFFLLLSPLLRLLLLL